MIRNIAAGTLILFSLLIVVLYSVKGGSFLASVLWKDKRVFMVFSIGIGIILLILNRIILGTLVLAIGVLIAITSL